MSDTRISEKALRAFMERAYEKEGFEAEEARQIADVLMQADLFGIESHGAQRMMYYHQNIKSGSVDVRARAEVLRETPVSALMDGHFAMGHLTAAKAMRMAIEKAKTAGIGMVAVRNSSHYGIAGYYPLMAEREGLAAFSMTNTGPIMVPTFGREMMLGTNPMAFCMPADPYPFWFDASTTVVTLGKVEVYNKRGKPMPEGWTIDGAGQPARMDVILRQLARLHAFTVLSGGGVALENTAFPFIVAQKAGPAKGAKNASAQQRCHPCQRSHFAALQSGFLKRFGGPQPSELYSESSNICGGFGNLARFPCAYAADGEACGEA